MSINYSEKIPNNVNLGLNEHGGDAQGDAPLYIPHNGLK
jgi:hypothetical protein